MNPLADFAQQIIVPVDPAPQALEILTHMQQLMDGRHGALHACRNNGSGPIAFAPILVQVVVEDLDFFDTNQSAASPLHEVLWDLIVRGRAVELPVTICLVPPADLLRTSDRQAQR